MSVPPDGPSEAGPPDRLTKKANVGMSHSFGHSDSDQKVVGLTEAVDSPARGQSVGQVARRRALAAVCNEQFGYFTTADAQASGYDRRSRSYQRRSGNWRVTEAPGVMRVANWPDDCHEGAHSWALWFGPLFQATSWTGLELFDLAPVDLTRPVDVVLLEGTVLDDVFSRSAREHLWLARRSGQVVLHRVQRARRAATIGSVQPDSAAAPIIRYGVAVRPAAEALCLALSDDRHRTAARELTLQLLDGGRIDPEDLGQTARAVGATRMINLMWELSR
ncbi:hypothetical protein BH10ACT3_BH10ACT3_05530 [soil metagenome]